MVEKKIYSASCPNLTLDHNEWTIKKLNSIKISKSLPNMALSYHELEIETKNMTVSNTFEIEHIEKFSASCPNLMLKHEWTNQKLNSVKKTKSLPNMALSYHELQETETSQISEIIAEKECANEDLRVPKKKRQTPYKRFKRSNCYDICLNLENLQTSAIKTGCAECARHTGHRPHTIHSKA
ncbi:hypothetical protein AGLY_005098 [Aphis glycines]|uniref:Uncharacterized protein n=1 Tax=Aphis glycines TaxID=307491 RepID=A0A6G0TX17_APHGL|nr:hypothetical protein AGLY_005098 [Aphis glycines]